MLRRPSPEDAQKLREFLVSAGFTEENLRGTMGMQDLPSSRLRNYAHLLDKTSVANCINILVRWFWIGTPQETSDVEPHLPDWFLPLALDCGLLYRRGTALVSEAMLFPTDNMLFASDHTSKIDLADAELVLWPNPTSRLLSRFTVRQHSKATLDLGTGTGIQALLAAPHSDRVVATDLSRRSVAFADFNAGLNGVANVEFRQGDGFEPVRGSKFDLIVSNPPFFISPSSQYMFCDNPLDLDQLCQRLVREAPNLLSEGGYFEVMCEWAEIHGQPWQERLSTWFEGTGCDVWGLRGYVEEPGEYALERIRSINPDPQLDAEVYANYMAYYRQRQVKAIHGGLIAMRRRSGSNWIYLEEVKQTPKEPFGDLVVQTFAVRDFLIAHGSDDDLLGVKPKLAPDVKIEQVYQQFEGGWKRESLSLTQKKGLDASLALDPLVAEFISECDGVRTLGEIIGGFTAKVSAPAEQVKTECQAAVRRLIERGFLTS